MPAQKRLRGRWHTEPLPATAEKKLARALGCRAVARDRRKKACAGIGLLSRCPRPPKKSSRGHWEAEPLPATTEKKHARALGRRAVARVHRKKARAGIGLQSRCPRPPKKSSRGHWEAEPLPASAEKKRARALRC